jgi:hypothetical protein
VLKQIWTVGIPFKRHRIDVLIFSFVGMNATFIVGSSNTVNVKMQRSSLGGSCSRVQHYQNKSKIKYLLLLQTGYGSQTIEGRPTPRFIQTLQAQVAV